MHAHEQLVQSLLNPDLTARLHRKDRLRVPAPDIDALDEAMTLLRHLLFPGYYDGKCFEQTDLSCQLSDTIERLETILSEQIYRALCFERSCRDTNDPNSPHPCRQRAGEATLSFLFQLPHLAQLLSTDVDAAYAGDPAASSPSEVILCYPSIYALTHHRVAHALLSDGVPFLPRMISELSHRRTGIDIHPAAQIGSHFFIDHGTGVVIGQTCIIGQGVKIYQGVTLGAKSFPANEDGSLVKGILRHPIIEDDVVIYAGATVLGRVTIGRGSRIGSNVWLTHDTAEGSIINR